jgi:hypothetical protein
MHTPFYDRILVLSPLVSDLVEQQERNRLREIAHLPLQ